LPISGPLGCSRIRQRPRPGTQGPPSRDRWKPSGVCSNRRYA